MNNNNMIVAVLVVAVIVLAAWFAYREGWLQGSQQTPNPPGVQINLPTSSPSHGY